MTDTQCGCSCDCCQECDDCAVEEEDEEEDEAEAAEFEERQRLISNAIAWADAHGLPHDVLDKWVKS